MDITLLTLHRQYINELDPTVAEDIRHYTGHCNKYIPTEINPFKYTKLLKNLHFQNFFHNSEITFYFFEI